MAILFKTILFVFLAFQIFRPPDQVTPLACFSCVSTALDINDPGYKDMLAACTTGMPSPPKINLTQECPSSTDICMTAAEHGPAADLKDPDIIYTSRGCATADLYKKDKCCSIIPNQNNTGTKKNVLTCYCTDTDCNSIDIKDTEALLPGYDNCQELITTAAPLETGGTDATTTPDGATPPVDDTTAAVGPTKSPGGGSNSTHLRGYPQLLLLAIFTILILISCFNKQE